MARRTLGRNSFKLFALATFVLGALCATQSFNSATAARQASPSAEFFKEKVLPIFEANCALCHGATMQRGRLDVRSEASLLKGGTRDPAVVPGQAEQSLLYRLVTHKEEPAMPLGGAKLSDNESALIAEWI